MELSTVELQKMEYDNLSKEILDNSGKVYQVILFSAGGVGAILSWVLTADVKRFPLGANLFPFALLLLPALIIIPSMLLVETCMRSTARIAGFLRVYHETAESGLHWQTAVQSYRKDHGGKKRRAFRKSVLYVFGGLGAACIVCSVFAAHGISSFTDKEPVHFTALLVALYIAALSLFLACLIKLSVDLWTSWGDEYFDEQRGLFEKFKKRSAQSPDSSIVPHAGS